MKTTEDTEYTEATEYTEYTEEKYPYSKITKRIIIVNPINLCTNY